MKQWIAIYTKPRHEKKVLSQFELKGIESYLPLIRQKHRWSDRMKWVEAPIFNSYIFAHVELKDNLEVLQTRGVHNIVKFQNKIAVIPDIQITNLRKMIEGGFDPYPSDYFAIGDEVEVTGGPLKGINGIVSRTDTPDRLIIKIDAIQHAVAVQIERKFLKPIKVYHAN
ncbi:UpxY family transcription antiterminator [bacterium]|nr:UpxY family transcription antiterminator [bacterium]